MAKKQFEDLDPHQERVLREMIIKEMMKKIQDRIAGEDSKAIKSIKNLVNEQEDKKQKIESKLKNILNEKKKEKTNDDDDE
jgi:hypothetical protein